MYVGKAKNLKKRVTSYTQIEQLSQQKQTLVQTASQLKHRVLNSELEALLIEAELIRLHQPEFNIQLKDDKSPIYLAINNNAFPSLRLVRKNDLIESEKKTALGPFSSAYKLKQVLKIARKIFPWCDLAEQRASSQTSNPQQELKRYHRSCFYYHLDLCPGACIGQISQEEYAQNLEQLVLFLKGEKKEVIKHMQQQMKQLADELHFEQANKIKQKINLIEDVTSRQFKLKPDLILPALHDSVSQDALDHLRRILIETGVISRLQKLNRIEGYDVSNLMGENAAVSMVVFSQGKPDKSEYRLFNIRSLNTPNDYQMMKQAISRRSKHSEWLTPNLIVVDGGKGQVRAALLAWEDAIPVIGIEKNPDRLVIPVEKFRVKNRQKINYQIITLPPDHPTLHLVQNIRDESHRFAKKQHVRLRRKASLI